jgi:hypothetical protein
MSRRTPEPILFGAKPFSEVTIEPLWVLSSAFTLDDGSGTIGAGADTNIESAEYVIAHMLAAWAEGLDDSTDLPGTTDFGGRGNANTEMDKWSPDNNVYPTAWVPLVEETTVADAANSVCKSFPMLGAHLMGSGKYAILVYPNATGTTQDFDDSDGSIVLAHPNLFHGDATRSGRPYAVRVRDIQLTPLSEVYNRFQLRYRKNTANVWNQTTSNNDGLTRRLDAIKGPSTDAIGMDAAAVCAASQDRYGLKRWMRLELPYVNDHRTAQAVLWFLVRRLTNQRVILTLSGGTEWFDLNPGHIHRVSDDLNVEHPNLDYMKEPAKLSGWAGSSSNNEYMVQAVERQPASTGVSVEWTAEQVIYDATGRRWTPDQDDSSCIQMLDADAISGSSDGDALAVWTATVGTNAQQSTADYKPTYQTNEVESKLPVVRFDGSNDYMYMTGLASASGDFTIYLVVTPATAGAGASEVLFDTQTGRLFMMHRHTADGNIYYYDGAYRAFATAATTGLQLQCWKLDDANSVFYRNGTAVGATPAYTQRAIGGAVNLCASITPSNFFGGDLAAFSIHTGAHSDATRQLNEGYYAWYWGLNESLPTNHPHYNVMPTV